MAKKTIRYVKEDQKEFVSIISSLSNRFQTWQIWSDFIVMFAISISNAIDKVHFEPREKMYMRIINKYEKKEQEQFLKLAAILVNAMEADRDRDFLGELYMALNLGNHWKGQFFTPYNVCKMMARMNTDGVVGEIEENGYIQVNDCCCGAGALLIAYANAVHEKTRDSKYNWQNHILFVAQDIDMITGLMCYIQLSLLGCAGYVKIGDSLSDPIRGGEVEQNLQIAESNYWYTPMYFSEVWHYRRIWHSFSSLFQSGAEDTLPESAEEKEKTITTAENSQERATDYEFHVEDNGQLSLF